MSFLSWYRKNMIRFRHWSRKAYAAFASLGKHVTIGHVCKSIAEASLCKSVNLCMVAVSRLMTEKEEGELCWEVSEEMERLQLASWLAVVETSCLPMGCAVRCTVPSIYRKRYCKSGIQSILKWTRGFGCCSFFVNGYEYSR